MGAYDLVFDKVLTRTDPEQAHHAAFRAIRAASPALRALPRVTGDDGAVEVMGLRFDHRFGLAAGFDKSGVGIDALGALGFSHVEIGTVTGLAQPGNPRPRLFRLPADAAVVNRMGFNNDGAAAVAQRLAVRADKAAPAASAASAASAGRTPGVVLGINIGKTKVVPEDDEAAVLADYALSTRLLAPYADYLVVNVSSPNTPGLRSLQAVERLGPLVEHVRRTADAASPERRVPLLVKIAPDLADADVLDVADLAAAAGLDGIIATNTTIARDGLRTADAEIDAIGAGGLSGPPVAARAREVLRLLRQRLAANAPRIALISVGGVDSPSEALARVLAGADLVQAYTGFIYGGPSWPRRVARHVAAYDRSTP